MTDKELAVQCVQMLEKYLNKDVKNLPNNNGKVMALAGEDMTSWKNTYYPQLVQNGKIADGVYFQNPLKDMRLGIGNDGEATKLEYLHFMWSAYKFILGDFEAGNETLKTVKSCIKMLEAYTKDYENQGTGVSICDSLKNADMTNWKNEYYPKLSKSGMVPDAVYFGTAPHMGIGSDGEFYAEELFHFLYRLYRLAYIILN